MLVGKASPDDYNLHPSQYPWAYDLYNQAVRNTWFPHEIALKEDLEDWAKMTEDERHAVADHVVSQLRERGDPWRLDDEAKKGSAPTT